MRLIADNTLASLLAAARDAVAAQTPLVESMKP